MRRKTVRRGAVGTNVSRSKVDPDGRVRVYRTTITSLPTVATAPVKAGTADSYGNPLAR